MLLISNTIFMPSAQFLIASLDGFFLLDIFHKCHYIIRWTLKKIWCYIQQKKSPIEINKDFNWENNNKKSIVIQLLNTSVWYYWLIIFTDISILFPFRVI